MVERANSTIKVEEIAQQDKVSMRLLRIIDNSKSMSFDSFIANVLDSELIADGTKATHVGFAKLVRAGFVTLQDRAIPVEFSTPYVIKSIETTARGRLVLEEVQESAFS